MNIPHHKKIIVAPSLLSCDFGEIRKAVRMLDRTRAGYLHWDVMDGHFVPNLTMGPGTIRSVRKDSGKTFDVHLMLSNPDRYIDDFAGAGADIITFHIESDADPEKVISLIKSSGKRAGISIKPKTSVKKIEKYLAVVDMVLIMSVEPGFGGQVFIKNSLKKISRLKELREGRGYKYNIEVDGGINMKTGRAAIKSGADILVTGSWLFKQKNIPRTIRSILDR